MDDIELGHRLLRHEERALSRSLTDSLEAARRCVPSLGRLALLTVDPVRARVQVLASSDTTVVVLAGRCWPLSALTPMHQAALSGRPVRTRGLLDNLWRAQRGEMPWLLVDEMRDGWICPLQAGPRLAGVLLLEGGHAAGFADDDLAALMPQVRLVGDLVGAHAQRLHALVGAVRSALAILHAGDPGSGHHLQRVARYAELMAVRLADRGIHLPAHTVDHIALFAPLHDMGCATRPGQRGLPAGGTTGAEVAALRERIALGERMALDMIGALGLRDSTAARVLINLVRHHHERCDGSGHPRGLRRDEIPIEARILAVADAYDAMSSHRHESSAWDETSCQEMLREDARTLRLDPDCVEALLADDRTRLAIRYGDADGEAPQACGQPPAIVSEASTTSPCAAGNARTSACATCPPDTGR